ncbi:MAG: NAD-glutamate dehydrogenase, partial [Flavobacteriales bacterium]|nr:NAD-glutamate dehydrogenase [Flavobacteriales bacterium]
PSDQSNLQIDTFRLLVDSESGEKDYVKDKKRLINGLDAIFGGCIPSDTMNRLMLRPGLGWNDVDVLRSYMRYSIQIGPFFDSSTVDRILCQYPDLTDCLVEFFHAKFNPKLELKKGTSRADYMKKKKSVFLAGMDKVRDSTEDRVFRVLFNLMEATVRTNAFRPDRRFHYLSFKFDCAKLDHCPEPRPLYEIYVRHAEMEGCHLRSGLLARGGLRWSDRLDDYRTEIFGLMRAQKEKNVLIVPQGAKGGFTVLGNPQPGQDWKAYGDKMYKVLIRGMLDITDNQIEGKEVRPPGVVCHDPFDPYLVVAADKGTAHLSDTANGLALEYGFWLGDAFASGGSAGYDHKAEGITAKGAWTCVRHHFGKLGVDPERDVIRVVGIGDLSGDVFGNGMMLSKTIKLVGAFNHRDIFLDPDPDCAVSFIERQRMFALPRSGWTDYDKKVISKGGGVFPRSEKSLPLSPQIQKLLGTEEKELSPEEVIQKLLTLDVDLIYNGGLGTYIKSSQEAHADVGDKSNDSVRVDACDIRARVVGEGGNLGVTQKGRIEYALNGGYINTDAIDNSAGVDCSDREVNLKVLFGPLVASGKLNNKERDEILEVLTPEVLAKILKDNDAHALCLSLDEIRSKKDPYQYLRTMDFLSEKGVFNPKKEDLPTIEDLQQRGVQKGYARPELSKLMAFFKMYAKAELLRMDDFSFPLKDEFLKKYFPQLIYEKYHGEMSSHILIRELLATLWIGDIVNDCGSANFADLIINSERSVLDVAYAYTASKKWMKAEEIKQRILACNEVPMSTRFQGIEAVEEGVKTASSWALHFFSGKTLYERIGDGQEFESTAKEYHEACASVMGILSSSTSSVSSELFKRDIRRYESMKFPHDLAWDIAASTRWSFVFPVAYLARKMKTSPDEAAEAYLRCGQVTGMHGILLRMAVQSSSNRWEVQALRSLLASLRRTILNLSERVLEVGIDKVLSRDPSIAQVGEEIAKLHANPLDPVPVPFLVVMGEKLHKAVTRDFENGVNTG